MQHERAVSALSTEPEFLKELRIPKEKLHDFLSYCQVDPAFDGLEGGVDPLSLWDFYLRKAKEYRRNNGME